VEQLKRLGRLFLRHRRRLARFVILVGLIVVGTQIFQASPRETEIRYGLGPRHDDVVELRIAYAVEGEEAVGARFRFEDGAPRSVRHTVELHPGRYEVRADVMERGGQRSVERALRVPADGVVHIDLFEIAYADAGGGGR